MSEWVGPLLLLGLVAMAVLVRRVVQARLANAVALLAAVAVATYATLEILPRVRDAYLGPLRVQYRPAAARGVLPDGQPTEIAIQVYQGSRLLQEGLIGAPSAATLESLDLDSGDGPLQLRLEPIPDRPAFQVLLGDAPIGELSRGALADVGLIASGSGSGPGPPGPAGPLAASGSAGRSDPAGTPPVGKPAADSPDRASAPPEPPPVGARGRVVRGSPGPSGRPLEEDSEVELRARASQEAVRDPCRAARLLERGMEERTQALARLFQERCVR